MLGYVPLIGLKEVRLMVPRGLGKELRDAFGRGDADWSDWRATRSGVRCATPGSDVASIIACCENETPDKNTSGEPVP